MRLSKPSFKFEADYFTNVNCPVHINSECEIICCKKGNIEITVNDERFLIGQNQALFIMPFEFHEFSTPSNSECLRFIIYSQSAPSFFNMLENKKILTRTFITETKTMNYIESILEPNLDTMSLKAITYALCRLVMKECAFEEMHHGELSTFTRALAYMSNNFTSGITLESTAKIIGVHPVHLSRTFKQNSKYSFTAYLNLLKFSHAQFLLKTTKKTITEISFESGFNSLRNFNRIFSSITKMSPSKYRNQSNKLPF